METETKRIICHRCKCHQTIVFDVEMLKDSFLSSEEQSDISFLAQGWTRDEQTLCPLCSKLKQNFLEDREIWKTYPLST